MERKEGKKNGRREEERRGKRNGEGGDELEEERGRGELI